MPESLSPAAVALCRENFGRLGAGCGRCPMHTECSTPVQPLTADTLSTWRGRVNSAAECACFPGSCRGGEVIGGRMATGQRCREHVQGATS